MKNSLKNSKELVAKVYGLARPYGRKKLILITALSFAQGLFQVLGVTSIFPFLALAADPNRLRQSQFGNWFLQWLPEMDDHRLLILAGAFAIAMLALSNGINLTAEFARTRYAHGFGHWLRSILIQKIASRSYTDLLSENSGVLIKKVVGDVMMFTTGILLPLLDSIARIATIALLIALLFLVHPQIAIVATLAFGFFYLIVYRLFRKWRTSATKGFKTANRGTFTEAQQLFGGIKPVKVHCVEDAFINRFKVHSKQQAKLSAWMALISSAPRYLIEPLAFGGVVVAVLISAARGGDLAVILPNLGVMALAGYRLLPAMQILYSQLNQLATTRHALEEVNDEFLAAKETVSEIDSRSKNGFTRPPPFQWSREIVFNDVSFQYPDTNQPALHHFNLTIPRNTSLGIIGSTGSGKSTLIDLLIGLHSPTEGEILIDSERLFPENKRAWRMGIGYVPQDIFLIDDTIAANIAFGIPSDQINESQLREAASAAQILELIENELPNGWETTVGDRGLRLSGGQRQRIGLARALYCKPSLLVLDEATSALDSKTELSVMTSIERLLGSMTMIFIAHRRSTLAICDQILNVDTFELQDSLPSDPARASDSD